LTIETTIPQTIDAGRTFDLIYKPGCAVEMRVFGSRKGDVASGYYDDRESFVRDAVEQDSTGRETVYATLNPVHPDLLARSHNILNRCDGTADKNIERFRVLLLDFDPKKVSGVSSTDAEKQAAYDKLLEVRGYLLGLGYPEPVIADSANGYHLLLNVDLPVGDSKLVRRFLQALNAKFGDEAVGIDTGVHNPARITKVYGTTPRNKGTGTTDRPVRPSKLLDVPEELHEVGRDMLLAVAGEESGVEEPKGYRLQDGGKFDVPAFIGRHGIEVLKEDEWDGPGMWAGSSKWIVECPWNGHTDNACHVIQNPEGVLSARCKHDSCAGKDWRDFREHYEPGSKVSRVPVPKYVGTPGTPVISRLSQKSRPTGGQPFLIESAVPENFPTVFYGDGGTMKTMLGEHLLLSVASGATDWLGHTINKRTDALIIDFELDEDTQLRRLYDLAAGMGMKELPDGLEYLEAAGLRTADVFAAALEHCQSNRVGLVLIDSLGVAMGGDMEGAKDVISFTRETIDQFRAVGTTAIIIDHQGKLQMGENYQSKTQYGSAYKKHLSRSVFQVEARESEPDERRITIRHKKTNFGPLMDPFGANITFEHQRITVEADELTQADLAEENTVNVSKRILLALEDGPAFPKELAEVLGSTPKTIKNRLSELRVRGKVEDTGATSGQSQQVRLSVPGVPDPIRDGDGDTRETRTNTGNIGVPDPTPKPTGDTRELTDALKEFLPGLNITQRRVMEVIAPYLDEHPDPFVAFSVAVGSDKPYSWTGAQAEAVLS